MIPIKVEQTATIAGPRLSAFTEFGFCPIGGGKTGISFVDDMPPIFEYYGEIEERRTCLEVAFVSGILSSHARRHQQ